MSRKTDRNRLARAPSLATTLDLDDWKTVVASIEGERERAGIGDTVSGRGNVRKSRVPWGSDWDQQIIDGWPQGVSQGKFARRFGVSLSRVQQAATRLGLLPSYPKPSPSPLVQRARDELDSLLAERVALDERIREMRYTLNWLEQHGEDRPPPKDAWAGFVEACLATLSSVFDKPEIIAELEKWLLDVGIDESGRLDLMREEPLTQVAFFLGLDTLSESEFEPFAERYASMKKTLSASSEAPSGA